MAVAAELHGLGQRAGGSGFHRAVPGPGRNMVQESPCRTGIREQAYPRTGKTEPRQAEADRDVHVCGKRRIASSAVPLNSSRASGT